MVYDKRMNIIEGIENETHANLHIFRIINIVREVKIVI